MLWKKLTAGFGPAVVLMLVAGTTAGPSAEPPMPFPSADSAAGDPSALTVSIAVPEHRGSRIVHAGTPFHVVVTNRSEETVGLWAKWCSWGYFSLSIELLNEEGKIIATIRRKPTIWDKNYPDSFVLRPGEHYVRTVSLQRDWVMPEIGDQKRLRMRAVFSIEDDGAAKEHHVWTGRVYSTPISVVLNDRYDDL